MINKAILNFKAKSRTDFRRGAGSLPGAMTVLVLAALMLAFGVARPALADNDKDAKPKPRDVGTAQGLILDAQTGKPVAGARVELIESPESDEVKGSQGLADGQGDYEIKVPLGKITRHFAAGRLLTLSIASIFGGGAKEVRKFIDVTQLNLKVTAPGYRPFYGTAPVKEFYPIDFGVGLQPIALAPEGAGFPSYVDPTIQARFKEMQATLSMTSTTPQMGDPFELRLVAPATSRKDKEDKPYARYLLYYEKKWVFKWGSHDLKLQKDSPPKVDVFVDQLKLKGKMQPGLYRIEVYPQPIQRFFALAAPVENREAIAALLQKLNEAADLPAEEVSAATIPLLRQLAELWPQSPVIGEYLADLLLEKDQPVPALKLLEAYPDADEWLLTRAKAEVEFDQGHHGQAYALYKKYYQKLPKEMRDPKIGKGNRTEKEYLAQDITAINADPTNFTARLDLYNRTSKAPLAALRPLALQNLPALNTPQHVLGIADLLVAQSKTAEAEALVQPLLAQPPEDVKTRLQVADFLVRQHRYDDAYTLFQPIFSGKDADKLKDFYAFHNYGVTLLARGDAEEGLANLGQALQYARMPSDDFSSRPTTIFLGRSMYSLYTGPSVIAAVGYLYPEAAADALILENYSAFRDPQNHWLAAAVLGRAMAQVGLTQQALPLLQKLAEENPQEPEVLLSYAVALQQSGKTGPARKIVASALKLNTHNPEAQELQRKLSS